MRANLIAAWPSARASAAFGVPQWTSMRWLCPENFGYAICWWISGSSKKLILRFTVQHWVCNYKITKISAEKALIIQLDASISETTSFQSNLRVSIWDLDPATFSGSSEGIHHRAAVSSCLFFWANCIYSLKGSSCRLAVGMASFQCPENSREHLVRMFKQYGTEGWTPLWRTAISLQFSLAVQQ